MDTSITIYETVEVLVQHKRLPSASANNDFDTVTVTATAPDGSMQTVSFYAHYDFPRHIELSVSSEGV